MQNSKIYRTGINLDSIFNFVLIILVILYLIVNLNQRPILITIFIIIAIIILLQLEVNTIESRPGMILIIKSSFLGIKKSTTLIKRVEVDSVEILKGRYQFWFNITYIS